MIQTLNLKEGSVMSVHGITCTYRNRPILEAKEEMKMLIAMKNLAKNRGNQLMDYNHCKRLTLFYKSNVALR